MIVWDPFCRDGQVLLELLSVSLSVPPVLNTDRLPCARLRQHRPQAAVTAARSAGFTGITFLGSDRSKEAIVNAQSRLLHFCDFYRDHLPAPAPAPPSHVQGKSTDSTEPRLPKLLQGPTILDDGNDRNDPAASLRTSRPPRRRPKGKASKATREGGAPGSRVSMASAAPVGEDEAEPREKLDLEDAVTFSAAERGLGLPCEVSLNVASFAARSAVITPEPSKLVFWGPSIQYTPQPRHWN